MKMTIQFKCGTTYMFDIFTTESCTSYAFSIIIVFLLSILYEYFLYLRCNKVCELTENQQSYQMIDSSGQNMINQTQSIAVSTSNRILLTLHYTLIVIMSYLLMFILMTYNFGVIMAVILGNTVGYTLFFTLKSKKYLERTEKVSV